MIASRIVNKSVGVVARAGIALSVRLAWPRLTAVIFIFLARRLNSDGDRVILCLAKSIFSEDVKAMATFSSRFSYVFIPAIYFRTLFVCIVGPEYASDHASYYRSVPEEKRRAYRSYLARMIPYVRDKVPYDAVLSGNYVYTYQQELACVCEESGIPFIVLHKEGVAIPSVFQRLVETYTNGRFVGSKMLVYNEGMKRALLNQQIAGLSEDRIEVVGVPRLDRYFRAKSLKADGHVVLFSFRAIDKLRHVIKDARMMEEAENRAAAFHRQLMECAARNGDRCFIIKTKASRTYLDYALAIFRSMNPAGLKNLVVTNKGDAYELTVGASVVMGFNSTTLVEALLACKTVVCPYYGDIPGERSWNFFADYPDLVHCVKTASDMDDCILNWRRYSDVDTDRKHVFLKEMIGNPDGRASERAENAIGEVILNARMRAQVS